MNALYTYIFKHNRYKEVIALSDEAVTKYGNAYKVWAEHQKFVSRDTFQDKEVIANHLSDIQKIDGWIKKCAKLKSSKLDGMLWLFREKGYLSIPELHYEEYKFIDEKSCDIEILQNYFDSYSKLMREKKEAVDRFLKASKDKHSDDEIKRIASSKDEINKIALTLNKAHQCQALYPKAWKVFAKGKSINEISLKDLDGISKDNFSTKEDYLKYYEKNPLLIQLVMGESLCPVDSFTKDAIEQHEDVLCILCSKEVASIEPFNVTIQLEDQEQLKRAILDSQVYGDACRFADSFTIRKFYALRADLDKIDVTFDDAVAKVKENREAIKAYHQEEQGKSQVFIEDYLHIVTPNSPLYNFVESYKQEREKRQEAKRIQHSYPKGFSAIYGIMNLDSCKIQYILGIISNESEIQKKNQELEEQERIRIERERRLQEERERQLQAQLAEERRRQEKAHLLECVSNWYLPTRSSLRCFSMYNYYPTTCDFEADDEEWAVRNLIWDFKANPNKPMPKFQIMQLHTQAAQRISEKMCMCLRQFFGDSISKLTLVCIPSSKQEVTQRRYEDFSEMVCYKLGMENAYPHIHVTEDGEASHLGGSVHAQISIDTSFFNGKYVLLFDDVITSGRSMESLKYRLERAGANVVAGFSIGRTIHTRQSCNPIDNLDQYQSRTQQRYTSYNDDLPF
jgi:predicted amidophosphoribosyltransferase